MARLYTTPLQLHTAAGTDAIFSEAGIDKSSAAAETFNIQNSGAGAMTLQVDGNTVWHAGNDGSGSGLDADTIDGLDSSAFVSTTGVATLTNKTIALGSNTISGTKAQFDTAVTDDNFAYLATPNIFTSRQVFNLGQEFADASGYMWYFTGATSWGQVWDTTLNVLSWRGNDIVRLSVDLDNGDVEVAGVLTNAGVVVPSISSTNTLTNKTIALGSNSLSGTIAQFNTALTDGDFATLAGSETLTNKTIGAATLAGTLSRAADQTIDLTGAATRTLFLTNSTASQVANLDVDGTLFFRNNTSFTIQLTGTPTANRVVTIQDAATQTLVARNTTDTLTNKTIALGSNTVSGTLAQFNTAVTDADLASLTGTETLTNKTIALGSNTVSGTMAQFNAACTDGVFLFASTEPYIYATGTVSAAADTSISIPSGAKKVIFHFYNVYSTVGAFLPYVRPNNGTTGVYDYIASTSQSGAITNTVAVGATGLAVGINTVTWDSASTNACNFRVEIYNPSSSLYKQIDIPNFFVIASAQNRQYWTNGVWKNTTAMTSLTITFRDTTGASPAGAVRSGMNGSYVVEVYP